MGAYINNSEKQLSQTSRGQGRVTYAGNLFSISFACRNHGRSRRRK